MPNKDEILEDFERYAYIIESMLNDDKYVPTITESDDLENLKLKYKFLR